MLKFRSQICPDDFVHLADLDNNELNLELSTKSNITVGHCSRDHKTGTARHVGIVPDPVNVTKR